MPDPAKAPPSPDLSFLTQLSQRAPGQSVDDMLVERVVDLAAPAVGQAVRVAAIPITVDADLLAVLLQEPDSAGDLLRQVSKSFSFITAVNSHYTYYNPSRQAIRRKFYREEPDRFRRLNALAASYFEQRARDEPAGAVHDAYVRQVMYHLLAADAASQPRGLAMLKDLFDQAEAGYQPGVAYSLYRLAEEQREYLDEGQRPMLRWLEGRLARLQGHPEQAVAILQGALDTGLPAELRPAVMLTLAGALSDNEQWADAIGQAQAAGRAFADAGDNKAVVRSLIEQARAYEGLARSVRGTRLVRPPIANPVLNWIYQLGSAFERLPILVYLALRLGVRRVLPVLGGVARDQDWVVARLFVAGASCLARGERLLLAGASKLLETEGADGQAAAADAEALALWIEARTAHGTLYRTLGDAPYAIELFEEVLGHRVLAENPYHLARIRLELAYALFDAGEGQLAVEVARMALPTYESLGDRVRQAAAHLLIGRAILSVDKAWPGVRPDRLHEATQELAASLNLYTELGDAGNRALVASVLDDIAGDQRLNEQHPVRVEAQTAAGAVEERRFPVRYEHPLIRQFRIAALGALAIAVLLILFVSVRTQSGTEVGATALFSSGPLPVPSSDFTPAITVQLPTAQLTPRFLGQRALGSGLLVLLLYLALYTLVGVVAISLSSMRALREAEARYVVLDPQGLRFCTGSEKICQEVTWEGIEEVVRVNRDIYTRPIADFSHLTVFGAGAELDVPGLTAGYESGLARMLSQRLAAPSRNLGFSLVKSWAGPLFIIGLLAQVVFLAVGQFNGDLVLRHVLGPYSASDLYVYSYLALLAPLAWWLVVNPLREALTLRPESRWPLALGAAGLVVELAVLQAQAQLAPQLVHPNVYPILVGAFLAVAAAAFVLRARWWRGRPSIRGEHVYPVAVRAAAGLIAVAAVGLALAGSFREVRAYHALVLANARRDALGKTDAAQPSQPIGQQLLAEADRFYTEAIGLSPYSPAAFASRGSIRLLRGDFDASIADFGEALAIRSDQPIIYANRARAYEDKAAQVSAPVQAANPRDRLLNPQEPELSPDAATLLLNAAFDYGQALKLADRPDYHLRRGAIYLQLQQYSSAAAEFSQTLRIDAHNADAYAGLGWTNFHNALQALQKAQQADKASNWQDGEASRHEAQLAWLGALEDFRSADALLAGRGAAGRPSANALADRDGGRSWQVAYAGPPASDGIDQQSGGSKLQVTDTGRRRANALNGQAWVALKLQHNESALELFQQAAQQDPGNPDYHLSAGNVYWIMAGDHQVSPDPAFTQRIEGSIAEYQKAENLATGTRDAAYQGWIYRTLGQFYYLLRNQAAPHTYQKEMEQALAVYARAVQLDLQSDYLDYRGRIGYALGDYFFRQGDRAAAEQVWQTAWADMDRARTMGHATAKGDLAGRLDLAGKSYQAAAQQSGQAGDWAAALDYFRRANSVDPNSAAYLRDVGWTYHLMGQDSQAITPTLQAIGLAQNDPVAYFSLALIHLSTGQADQAGADYQNALKIAVAQKADVAKSACTGALANLNQFNQKRPASLDESVVDRIILTIVQKCLTP